MAAVNAKPALAAVKNNGTEVLIIKKAVALFLAFILAFALAGCGQIYGNTDYLIEKVREELPLADADTVEIKYAGTCGKGNTALIWYITGNENQAHTCFPIECKIIGQASYMFIRSFNSVIDDRCSDVGILQWKDGYSFCVNNPECKTVRITDSNGTRDEAIPFDCYPYIIYTEEIPTEYIFLDAEGNELR